MRTKDKPSEPGKLRVTIRMGEGLSAPLLVQGTELPAEATYTISNRYRIPARKIELCFGDNEWYLDNVRVGGFNVDDIPLASQGGPSQISLKVSVSARQELCLAVLDPLTTRYRSIGFIDISKIEPPAILPPLPGGPFAFDFNEIVGKFVDAVSDDPAKRRKPPAPRFGKDVSCRLPISFDEALNGAQKRVDVLRAETCPTCAGSGSRPGTSSAECDTCQGTGSQRTEEQTQLGKVVTAQTCSTCHGAGRIILDPCTTCHGRTQVHITRPFTVSIPSRIDPGAQICVLNEGEPGQNGGQSGNLYVTVTVTDHPLFTRIGRDVAIHLPVRSSFAIRGGQLRVPGVEAGSFFLLHLPPSTRSGTAFRLLQNDSCTLTAIVDTYSRLDPVALLRTRKRLQAIDEALKHKEFEVRA